MHPEPIIVLFDGECGFCQQMTSWVAERNQAGRILFATLQGEAAAVLGENRQTEPQSVVVWIGSQRIEGAAAVWVILQRVGGVWAWLGSIGGALPRALADLAYHWIAQRRYRWQNIKLGKHLSLYDLAE